MSHIWSPVPPPTPQTTKDEAGVSQAEVRGEARGEAGGQQQHDGDTHHPPPEDCHDQWSTGNQIFLGAISNYF